MHENRIVVHPSPTGAPVKNWADDNEELLAFCQHGKRSVPENFWSLNDAFQGVQVFGGTGSGKTSGSGQALARAFLETNMGGLVLTAKTDEVDTWKRYARDTGRETDLLILDEDSPYRFNFLKYELTRPGKGAGHTENIVSLFTSVLEVADKKQGHGGGNEAYWQRALKQLLRNTIDLAVLALDDIDLPSLYQIITSAPRSAAELSDQEWRSQSACMTLLDVAEQNSEGTERRNDFEITRDFWTREYPGLADDTRSSIVSTFTSMADCFLRGLLRKLFCTDLNIRPEDTFSGKIIVINLPVKEFNELGQFAQVLFKFVWQRSVERRIPPVIDRKVAEETIRPVFLWADEAQFFANSYDALFQSTARASRVCTVYLTQNLPSYFAAFGGPQASSEVEAFLGNLQTKVWHSNGDPTTNNWAAGSIGRTRQMQYYGGLSESMARNAGAGMNQNAGGSFVFEYLVQPQEFTILRTGGEECEFEVDAIIFQGGRRWIKMDSGKREVVNYVRHVFPQRYH